MIVFGAVRPGRNSLGIFLPWTPRRQVPPFTSGGGGGGMLCSAPPPVRLPPRDLRCLPVLAERVDACLRPPVTTSHTGGSSLVVQ